MEYQAFREIPDLYKEVCKTIKGFKFSNKYLDEFSYEIKNTVDNQGNLLFLGSGRMETIGEIGTLFCSAKGYSNTHCSSDSSYSRKYYPKDTVIAISGSGETNRTLDKLRPLLETDAGIIGITANKKSTLAELVENNGGLLIYLDGKHKDYKNGSNGDYYNKQINGNSRPLTLEGTEVELKTLQFLIDYFGSEETGKTPKQFHNSFCDNLYSYTPDSKEFINAYERLPKVTDFEKKIYNPNKTVMVGEGLSGKSSDFLRIRLNHCSKKRQERRVESYKTATAIRPNDALFVFSVSGEGLPYTYAKKAQEKGARVIAMTSEGSLLDKISDNTIHIPNRIEEKVKGDINHMQSNPERCLPEFISLLNGECFVYAIVGYEGLEDNDLKSHHSDFT